MENIVYRHEEKYILSKLEAEYLKKLLAVVCQKDTYSSAEDGHYRIRSLYFDSCLDTDYQEKILGVCNRKKIRLRIYDLNTVAVKLEIKNRIAEYSIKETITMDVDDALQLIEGNPEILLTYGSRIAGKVYCFMKKELYSPKKIVDYRREAYIYPMENIRITFDSGIETCNELDFLNPNLMMYPVIDNNTCILEVKYDKALPVILKEILSTSGCCRMAYSKYSVSRNME